MTRKKLYKLRRKLADLRQREGNIKPAEMERLAVACGRGLHTGRGKEPTWVSKYFPKLLRPLGIPHHSKELNPYTAASILDQLETDLDAIEESLQAQR